MITDYPILIEEFPTVATLFNFTYPKSTEYATIEKVIFNHYKNYRIAEKDVDYWHESLEDKMNEVMPFANKMYDSAALELEFEIFENYNMTTTKTNTHTESNSDTKTESETGVGSITNVTSQTEVSAADSTNTKNASTTDTAHISDADSGYSHDNSTDTDKKKFLNTPMGTVDTMDDGYLTNYTDDLKTNDTDTSYLKSRTTDTTKAITDTVNETSAADSTMDTDSTSDIDSTSTKNKTLTNSETKNISDAENKVVSGKTGNKTYQEMLREYREVIMDANKFVVGQLAELFICCFN
jgi:hypothetical protein